MEGDCTNRPLLEKKGHKVSLIRHRNESPMVIDVVTGTGEEQADLRHRREHGGGDAGGVADGQCEYLCCVWMVRVET